MSTKIAWTNELIVPMQIYVALSAHSPYVKYMGIAVPQMVVIIRRFAAVIKTRKRAWFRQFPGLNCIIQCTRNLLLSLSRRGQVFPFHSHFDMAAVSAYWKSPIPSGFVNPELCFREPCVAFIAPFNAVVSTLFVLLYRNSCFLCKLFTGSIKCLSHVVFLNNNSNILCP